MNARELEITNTWGPEILEMNIKFQRIHMNTNGAGDRIFEIKNYMIEPTRHRSSACSEP